MERTISWKISCAFVIGLLVPACGFESNQQSDEHSSALRHPPCNELHEYFKYECIGFEWKLVQVGARGMNCKGQTWSWGDRTECESYSRVTCNGVNPCRGSGWFCDEREPTERCCDLEEGHPDFCATCGPCTVGKANCARNSDCDEGLVCSHNVGAKYGLPDHYDVCEEPCPLPKGHWNYCRDCGPCLIGEGDCDEDSDCVGFTPGMFNTVSCREDVGADYGWASGVDVCEETEIVMN